MKDDGGPQVRKIFPFVHFIAGVVQGGDLQAKIELLNILTNRGFEIAQIQSGMAAPPGGGIVAPDGRPKIGIVEIVTAGAPLDQYQEYFGPYDPKSAVEKPPAIIAGWMKKVWE